MTFLHITMDDQATSGLLDIAGKHVPFAAALALTKTAQVAQRRVRQHIQTDFTLRKRSAGFQSLIRIQAANKRNLTAHVYSLGHFAALQQLGGDKRAKDGRLAIPIYDNIKAVKRRSKRNSPAGHLNNSAFIMRLRSGDDAIAKQQAGRGLRILYLLKRRADVPKRLNMIETTMQVVKHEFAIQLQQSLHHVSHA